MKETFAMLPGWQADGNGGGLYNEGEAVAADAQMLRAAVAVEGWDAPLPALPVREALRTAELWRGEVMHGLLETLPHVPVASRREMAMRLVREAAPAWDETILAAAVDEILGVMEAVPWLFGAQSRAEAGVALPDGLGRMDRLVLHDGALWVIDFKTEASPPASVPAAYKAQLLGYATALKREINHLPIRAAVVWTLTSTLHEVDVSAASL